MSKNDYNDSNVIELGSVVEETKGAALFNQDNDGSPRNGQLGVVAD